MKKAIPNLNQDEWYFSIIDIVAVWTESPNPRRYWSNLKLRLSENEGFVQLYSKKVQLKLLAPDEKMRETDTAKRQPAYDLIYQDQPNYPEYPSSSLTP